MTFVDCSCVCLVNQSCESAARIIPATMTDKQLAVAIAERIINLQADRSLMVALLDDQFSNWRDILKKAGTAVEDSAPVSLKRELLQRLADSPGNSTTFLNTIYRYMLTGFPDSKFPS